MIEALWVRRARRQAGGNRSVGGVREEIPCRHCVCSRGVGGVGGDVGSCRGFEDRADPTARPARSRPTPSRPRPVLMMGLEYLTGGTMKLDGRKIVILVKDDQLKPDVAKSRSQQPMATTRSICRRHRLLGRHSRHAAGRRGLQEAPARRARGRRLASPATSGTATSSAPPATPRRTRSPARSPSAKAKSRSPCWRRTTPSAATALKAFKEALAAVAQQGQGRARGVRAAGDDGLHRARRSGMFDALKDKPGRRSSPSSGPAPIRSTRSPT